MWHEAAEGCRAENVRSARAISDVDLFCYWRVVMHRTMRRRLVNRNSPGFLLAARK